MTKTPDLRADVCDWLTALGIAPSDVPTDSDLYITTDSGEPPMLHFEVYVRDDAGRRLINAQRTGPVIERRSVPLTVEPPKHWQPHRNPTREELLAAVDRVRTLHQPIRVPTVVGERNACVVCDGDPMNEPQYPCATLAALDD